MSLAFIKLFERFFVKSRKKNEVPPPKNIDKFFDTITHCKFAVNDTDTYTQATFKVNPRPLVSVFSCKGCE